jgi:hypothetical protein
MSLWFLATRPAAAAAAAAAAAEFHSQGDTSRQEHPELDVLDMFNRDKADMPKAQVRLLITPHSTTKCVQPVYSTYASRRQHSWMQMCRL